MDNLGPVVLMILLGIALAGLIWRSAGAAQQRRRARAGFLDDCCPLFTSSLKAITETGFPRLSGQFQGHTFDIQVVPDSLSFRKLPALWLLVTLPAPLSVRGTFDLMMRPTGQETFSRFPNLPVHVALPVDFPEECAIRCDTPDALPSEPVLRRQLTRLTHDRLKELVIAPTGVRIVWLAEEADRGRYLLFRDAEMGRIALSPDVLRPLLTAVVDLWSDLSADIQRKESQSA
jgi:hypothetical protein